MYTEYIFQKRVSRPLIKSRIISFRVWSFKTKIYLYTQKWDVFPQCLFPLHICIKFSYFRICKDPTLSAVSSAFISPLILDKGNSRWLGDAGLCPPGPGSEHLVTGRDFTVGPLTERLCPEWKSPSARIDLRILFQKEKVILKTVQEVGKENPWLHCGRAAKLSV